MHFNIYVAVINILIFYFIENLIEISYKSKKQESSFNLNDSYSTYLIFPIQFQTHSTLPAVFQKTYSHDIRLRMHVILLRQQITSFYRLLPHIFQM